MTPRLGSRRSCRAALAACAAMLACGYVFFLFVVPLTPVRLEKTSAELDVQLGFWRVLRAHLASGLHGSGLLAALAAAACTCFLAYGLAVAAARALPRTRALVVALVAIATLFTAASAIALPNFDPDVYTYIATGRVAAVHHQDPYAVATDRFPGDPFFRYQLRNYTHHPDIKLPAWMPLNVGLAEVAGSHPLRGLLTYRGALALLALANLFLVLLIVRRLRPGEVAVAAVAWGWNPIVVLFGPSKADTLMVFFVLLAVLALTRLRQQVAVVFLTLATFVKLLAAPFLVVLVLQQARRGRWRSVALSLALIAVVIAALYAPYSHPWALLADHLRLANTAGAGGTSANSGARLLLLGFGATLVVALSLRRDRDLPELLRLWAAIGLVTGVAVAAGEFPWYLLIFIAVTVLSGDLLLLAGMSVLGLVSFLAYERRGASTASHPLPRLSPLSLGHSVLLLVAATAIVFAIVKLRRRGYSSVPG
jgi:hypothetical protein